MFPLSTLILTALLSALGGCLVTALLMRSFNPKQQQNHELEQRLETAEQKLGDYQAEVSEHFAQTSALVNNLTQSYKEVHQHLASSALQLANPDLSRQMLAAGDGKLLPEGEALDADEPSEAARDWAPKAPGEKGALSEDYGLGDERAGIEASSVNRDA